MVQACWSLRDDNPEVIPHSVRSRRSSSASSLNRLCGPAWPAPGRDVAASGTGLALHVVSSGTCDNEREWAGPVDTKHTKTRPPKPSPALPQTQVPPPTADRTELALPLAPAITSSILTIVPCRIISSVLYF